MGQAARRIAAASVTARGARAAQQDHAVTRAVERSTAHTSIRQVARKMPSGFGVPDVKAS